MTDTLNIYIRDQKICTDMKSLVAESEHYYKCFLHLDSSWSGCTSFTVVFTNKSAAPEVLVTGLAEAFYIPTEAVTKGRIKISVTGYSGATQVITTKEMASGIAVVQNGAISGDAPVEDTPTIKQQILNALNLCTSATSTALEKSSSIESLEDTVETAEAARANAESERVSAETTRTTNETAREVWEDYAPAKPYAPGNKAVQNGSSYICIKPTIGNAPPNATYWRLIAAKGETGLTGATGSTGAKGETGAIGATGNGIASYVLISGTHAAGTADTYRLTMTDGTTVDVLVYNGADGEGSGDMLAATYDPTAKAQDVFAYADSAEADAISTAAADATAKSNAAQAAAIAACDASGAAAAVQSNLNSHAAATNIHTTAAEKTAWNEKQDALTAGDNITISGNVISAASSAPSAISDSTITTTWNNA